MQKKFDFLYAQHNFLIFFKKKKKMKSTLYASVRPDRDFLRWGAALRLNPIKGSLLSLNPLTLTICQPKARVYHSLRLFPSHSPRQSFCRVCLCCPCGSSWAGSWCACRRTDSADCCSRSAFSPDSSGSLAPTEDETNQIQILNPEQTFIAQRLLVYSSGVLMDTIKYRKSTDYRLP